MPVGHAHWLSHPDKTGALVADSCTYERSTVITIHTSNTEQTRDAWDALARFDQFTTPEWGIRPNNLFRVTGSIRPTT